MMMDAEPQLVPGKTSVEVMVAGHESRSWRAQITSVLDAGIVLEPPSNGGMSLKDGSEVSVVMSTGGRAQEVRGVVAGSSSAGVAIELKGTWRPYERRGFPRATVCVPMRYRVLDDATAQRIAVAIRSRITDRPATRASEAPFERNEMAMLNARLQKIERALELLTDLVLWAGTGQSPLNEREVVISASGLSFEPDDGVPLKDGSPVELELLLPLRDPIRVRALGTVVRVSKDSMGRVAVKFDCIDESDRDEISRYVFQLQRRRRSTIL